MIPRTAFVDKVADSVPAAAAMSSSLVWAAAVKMRHDGFNLYQHNITTSGQKTNFFPICLYDTVSVI